MVLEGFGNTDYGWFIGGYSSGPTFVSIIDRIDYSNDTAATSSRGSHVVLCTV